MSDADAAAFSPSVWIITVVPEPLLRADAIMNDGAEPCKPYIPPLSLDLVRKSRAWRKGVNREPVNESTLSE
jgi:hypothetical protein